MSLIIPSEIKNSINPTSGYVKYNSKFGKKNLKGLFICPENIDYLVKELFTLITCEQYVSEANKNVDTYTDSVYHYDDLHIQFKKCRNQLNAQIRELVEEWKLPYEDEKVLLNPVQQLHQENYSFLTTSAKTIIQNPHTLIHDIYMTDPYTKKHDAPEWSYGAASYSDGTWHPEHLFTESKQNRANPYWQPLEVTFDTNPPDGPFHTHHNMEDRYSPGVEPCNMLEKMMNNVEDDCINGDDLNYPYTTNSHGDITNYTDGAGPGNRYMYDHYGDYTNCSKSRRGFSKGGTFPRWQYSVNHRPYQRNIDEGLSEGGNADRRIQRPSGYDMSALLSKSTY